MCSQLSGIRPIGLNTRSHVGEENNVNVGKVFLTQASVSDSTIVAEVTSSLSDAPPPSKRRLRLLTWEGHMVTECSRWRLYFCFVLSQSVKHFSCSSEVSKNLSVNSVQNSQLMRFYHDCFDNSTNYQENKKKLLSMCQEPFKIHAERADTVHLKGVINTEMRLMVF